MSKKKVLKMKLAINFCSDYTASYYCSYYDTKEGVLYFEVKLGPKIKGDLLHVKKIIVSKKHHYVGKTVDGAHVFKVIDYYNRWFERNME